MTKAELRSLVKNALLKIDNTNKYHNNVIDHSIEHAMNQIYGDLFRNNPSDLDDYTKSYGDDESPIAITLDSGTGYYYSTLPKPIVPIGDKASGVRHIRGYGTPVAGSYTRQDYNFVPMTRKELDLISDTYTGEYDGLSFGTIGYVVRRDKVQYYGLDATTHLIIIDTGGVGMDLLVPFTAFDDTDIVMLPFGQDKKIQEMIMVFLQQIQEPDLKDDN